MRGILLSSEHLRVCAGVEDTRHQQIEVRRAEGGYQFSCLELIAYQVAPENSTKQTNQDARQARTSIEDLKQKQRSFADNGILMATAKLVIASVHLEQWEASRHTIEQLIAISINMLNIQWQS